MGSDLSIVVRPCVPLVAEAMQEGPQLSFTELRLVVGTSCLESDRLLLAECTPFALSSLDLRDAVCYSVLHDELKCKSCAHRIGLAVDSSVRVGTRVHGADQRYAFTQGLSIFLSKLAAALSWSGTLGTAEDHLVGAQSSSLSQYVLLLIDLRHCLLDDVSGPWLVRDIEDLMGCVLHYHSAVSLISSARRGVGNSPGNPQWLAGSAMRSKTGETVYLYDDVTSCRLGPPAPTDSGALPIFDSSRATFCQSVQHIFLSHNNMSVVGLRKCLHSLLELSRNASNGGDLENRESIASHADTVSGDRVIRKGLGLWNLQSIDLQQNEESLAVRQMLSSMLHQTKVRVLVGTSGLRWRHTENDDGGVVQPATKLIDSSLNCASVFDEETERPALMEAENEMLEGKKGRRKEGGEEEEMKNHAREFISPSKASQSGERLPHRRNLTDTKQTKDSVAKSSTLQSSSLQKNTELKSLSPTSLSGPRQGPTPKKQISLAEGAPSPNTKSSPLTHAAKLTPRSHEESNASGPTNAAKGPTGQPKKAPLLTASRPAYGVSHSPKTKSPAVRSKALSSNPIVSSSLNVSAANSVRHETVSGGSNKRPLNASSASDSMTVPSLPIRSVSRQSTLNDSLRRSCIVSAEATPHENRSIEAEPLEGDLPAAYSPSPRQWNPPRFRCLSSERHQQQQQQQQQQMRTRVSGKTESQSEKREAVSLSQSPEAETKVPEPAAVVAATAERAAMGAASHRKRNPMRNQQSTQVSAKQRRTHGSQV